ncbi:hypothetical protein ACFSR7_01930 [Cohnella sp. GCM10020058]|uniref:hypothetical protein n=1 Tax=Cohnella sp. GCM10020058 TaxID=3317330 RepID=UPI0036448941
MRDPIINLEKVSIFQKKKLRDLIHFLDSNNKYFHDLFVREALDLNSGIECFFSRIPLTDKNDIKKNYDNYISKISEETTSELTSGTTGTPLKCIKTLSERVLSGTYIWKERLKWDPYVNKDNFLELLKEGFRKIGDFANFEKSNLVFCVNKLLDYSPRWINGTITVIERMAKIIEAGLVDYKPGSIKFIELMGEAVDEDKRIYIERVFGCKTINHYGTRESWAIAYECSEKNMHVFNNLFLIEIVNQGIISDYPDIGEIVVTSLYNKSMPLIRYKVGDFGKITEKYCKCGNKSSIINLAGGRVNSFLKGNNDILGDLFFKRIVFKATKKDQQVIDRYLVEQTDINNFNLYIKKGPKYKNETYDEIVKLTCEILGDKTKLTLFIVEDFPSMTSGKTTSFVRLC